MSVWPTPSRRVPATLTVRPVGRWWRRHLPGVVLVAATTAGLVSAASPAATAAPRTLSAQATPSVHATAVAPRRRPADLTQGANRTRRLPVHLPAAGSAEVDLRGLRSAAGTASAAAARVRAGTLPVWLGLPGHPAGAAGDGGDTTVARARVSVPDSTTLPAAWRGRTLLLRVARTDGVTGPGRLGLAVDYSSFSGVSGADWGSRLRLLRLPDCALTTPDEAGCSAGPVSSRNTPAVHQLTADVTVTGAGVTFAVTAGGDGGSSDFSVSSLQPSAVWSAGGDSGNFGWNYPMRSPPSLGGPAPDMSLAYSSSSVDGRSQATNNQPSWIGEGFDYASGFIERRYASCADDMGSGANNTTATGDLCWATDNANMSLSGAGGELIKDATTGTWRLKNDDDTKVERLDDTSGPADDTVNGAHNNEYWRLTTADGTQYYFGLNRLKGYTGTAPADKVTHSTWTVPVAGNNSGEPCHASSFASSFCTQAWRWNLDYVVDVHGNTMSLFYDTETNKYARNATDGDAVSYIRSGTLDHIDYGTDNRSGTDTENTSTPAPVRVQFGAGDRCLSGCATHDAAHWPDTPWDQNCSGTSCPGLYSPTFWSTKRLTTVTTMVHSGSAYSNVDTWTLTQNFPDPGDGTRAGMWLESIVHTGQASGTSVTAGDITVPSINFDWIQMPNRVDTSTDGKLPMNWMRIGTIWTETGEKISVRYTPQQCVAGITMPTSPQGNTLRCYPVLEKQPDKSITTEYFNKYLVSDVTEADLSGGGPDVVTSYEYAGTPAWRHTDDDGITPDNLRTWSDFRGYGQVNTRVGDPGSGSQTLSESTFFRGMNGDLDGSGGTRSVTLPAADINGDGDTADTADARPVSDDNAFAGAVRQTTVYDGLESAPVSTTVSEPWQSTPTATRDMGSTTVYARHVATKTTWTGTKLTTGGWRVSRSDNTFDDTYGMVQQTDGQGDLAVSGDESCTIATYDRNTARNLLRPTSRVQVLSVGCATTPTSDADIASDTRTSFDGLAYGATPTKGDQTRVENAKAWTPTGGSQWLVVGTTGYDAYGRAVDSGDVRGNHQTTAYTPTSGGPVTAVATTTALGTATQTLEPAWGAVVTTVDVNGRRSDANLDALGRVVAVWKADHPKASYPQLPNKRFDYLMRATGGPNAVVTQSLNASSNYVSSYALHDGLLRARQTQTPSAAAGHLGTVFSDTTYDAEGRQRATSRYFDATVSPSTTLYTVADWQLPSETVTEYDRAGRTTASVLQSAGVEKWRTTTINGGDRVSVVPPQGGTATTTLTDALGRTTEVRRYHDPADVGSDTRSLYDRTTYHYNSRGKQDQFTDNAGNTWSATFDLLGRQVGDHDPDKGTTSATYDDYGDLLTTTDARGQTLAYTYDSLGRRTGEYTPSTSGTRLATWAYDPPGAKGQPASQSRWIGTDEYKIRVRGYTRTYQATGVDYVIPASQAGLAGTYTFSTSYKVDGSTAALSLPNAGNLGAETLTYKYDDVSGLPQQLLTNAPGLGQYVTDTNYTAYGELSFEQYQTTAGNWLQRSLDYDDATRRLIDATTIRQISPQAVDDTRPAYDPAGDVTKLVDTPESESADSQCFGYDYAQRLTEAWTPTNGDCGQATSVSSLGGPAPYWQTWTFDAAGNRHTQVTHTVEGDTTATYSYTGACGNSGPHVLASVTTVGPGVDRTDGYCYDTAGDTVSRPGPTAGQTLAWDAEGKLSGITGSGVDTSSIYAPDGSRLVMSDGQHTTLYLPGMNVVRDDTSGAVTATRFYTWAGQTSASVSTGGELTWLVADAQGTGMVAVTAGSQAITRRWQTPYGGPRGTAVTWPNSKGFVGGEVDASTGLVHLGAREYDPAIGRFLSADPILDQADTNSWTGYAYANNTPVTRSDPTGQLALPPKCPNGSPAPDGDRANCSSGGGTPSGGQNPSGSSDGQDPGGSNLGLPYAPGKGPHQNAYLRYDASTRRIVVITTRPVNTCPEVYMQPSSCIVHFQADIMGMAVSCDRVKGGQGLCFMGSDGYFHDLYGHASLPPGTWGPRAGPASDPAPVVRGVPVSVRPLLPASCMPPGEQAWAGPPGVQVSASKDPCDTRGVFCEIAVNASEVANIAGWVPPLLCDVCGLVSDATTGVAALAYALDGDSADAVGSLASLGASTFTGTLGKGLTGGEHSEAVEAGTWLGGNLAQQGVGSAHKLSLSCIARAFVVSSPDC